MLNMEARDVYGEMSREDIDQLLARNRFGRLGFTLDSQVFITPINYAHEAGIIYGSAPEGTKVRGMRQNPTVAFEVDEIHDPAHWRSVLLQGRFVELHDRQEKEAALRRIVAQAGGGERSEVSWALDLEHLVLFRIEVGHRSGRFEQREAFGLRPGRVGPLPPPSSSPAGPH
jgi:nitroimidazol reductase NimA-like FMN-containing flavoprotein (pyridoxamine 5'-phosphate oxidase superfamily)